jgi:hypothetical protein
VKVRSLIRIERTSALLALLIRGDYHKTPWVASHLLHMLLIKNFLHGEQLDESPRSFVKCGAFALGVGSVAEGDEKSRAGGSRAFYPLSRYSGRGLG